MTAELILRLFIAGVLGGLIGFEREFRSKEAGLRTHFLVALGSALFMIISQYGFDGLQAGRFDVSRVAAQVVTGIGFIGAGIIIFQKNSVRGLTTAAGLWVTAAIGMSCGGGMYILAAVTTVMVLIVLEVMHYALPQFGEKTVSITFSADSKESLAKVMDSFKARRLPVTSYSIKALENGRLLATIDVKVRHGEYTAAPGRILDEMEGIKLISIE